MVGIVRFVVVWKNQIKCASGVKNVRLVLGFCSRLCFLVSNKSYRLLKPKIAALTTTVAVRSCTSWKNTSPHNREFEKKELPHDRELQPNNAAHHQFHLFDELDDDAHQFVLCLPAWLV